MNKLQTEAMSIHAVQKFNRFFQKGNSLSDEETVSFLIGVIFVTIRSVSDNYYVFFLDAIIIALIISITKYILSAVFDTKQVSCQKGLPFTKYPVHSFAGSTT